jgi:hypothetical protein
MVLASSRLCLNYDSAVDSSDIDQLLAEIRTRVAERRKKGDYPPGLEIQLESEFRGIVDRERRDWNASQRRLTEQMTRVSEAFACVTGIVSAESRILGGSFFHRLIARLTGRQVQGVAAQVRTASTELVELVRFIADLQQAQEDADRRLVIHLTKSTLDHLAIVDHLAILVTEIERRVDNLAEGQ